MHARIFLEHTSACNIVKGNIILNTSSGIHVVNHDHVIIDNIIQNTNTGMHMEWTDDIIIMDNIIQNNSYGMGLYDDNFNSTIRDNIIQNNYYGIHLIDSPKNNLIYHNNIINNTQQVHIQTSGNYTNFWDNGYPSGGNYWSDYNGTDLHSGPHQNLTCSDGIGDTPYIIDGNNQDNYPLMNPWTPTETSVEVKGKDIPVTIVSNTTINHIVTTNNTLHFWSSGPTGQKGYLLFSQ
jgi:parallel beta-helix repeat protein